MMLAVSDPRPDRDTDTPEARGAGLGVLGPSGHLRRLDDLESARSAVRPGTRLGAVNVALWIVAFCTIGLIGRFVIGGPGMLWLLIALALTSLAAWRWPWKRDRSDPAAD